MENNLSKAEFDALKALFRNKELMNQKADKGNTVVLLNKKDYISKMKLILADISKFKKMQIIDSKVRNCLIQTENKMVELLKKLKEKQDISDKVYNELYSKNLKKSMKFLIRSIMNYTVQAKVQVFSAAFGKIHKSIVDGVLPFHPTLSAIGTLLINSQNVLYH